MADNSDVFHMLPAEDKLDGTNYPLWSYMMRHVLVAKGLWNIMQGHYTHLASARTIIASVEEGAVVVDDVAGPTFASSAVAGSDDVGCTPEQAKWDGKDAQAHLRYLLSVPSFPTFVDVRLQRMHGICIIPCKGCMGCMGYACTFVSSSE